MVNRKDVDERRKHERVNIKNNLFAALGAVDHQKCLVMDISAGGLSLRYYEGSDLIKQLVDEKSVRLDLFVDKGELYLSQVPFKTVYDAEIDSEMPLDAVSIRKRGLKFGRLSKAQRSKLNNIVEARLVK